MHAVLIAASLAAPAQAAPALVDVAVLGQAVARGAVLEADDLTLAPRTPAQGRGALAAADAVGREATRNLAAGSVVRAADVVTPRLVRRGEPVTVAIRAGGMAITAAGRALGGGGRGDGVRVVILSTNRTVDAVVEATGEVRVTAR